MKVPALAIALAALVIPASALSALAVPHTAATSVPPRVDPIVGGLSVTLKQAAPVNEAVSDRGPVPPPAGRRWWRTIWHFQNVSHRTTKVQLPIASTGSIHDRARYFGGAAPHYSLQPKTSVNITWYFDIPRALKTVWFSYGGKGSTVIWFHVKMR